MEKNKTYTLKDKCKALGPGILVVGSFIGQVPLQAPREPEPLMGMHFSGL